MGNDVSLLRVLGSSSDEAFRTNVVSSILRYLLDPHADHGLGATLLRELLHDASSNWDAIDQALLDSLGCYPGLPDLDVDIVDAGSAGFVVLILYETALFLLGIQTHVSNVPPADAVETMALWGHRLGELCCSKISSRIPKITITHRSVIWLGRFVTAREEASACDLARSNRWVGLDTFLSMPWGTSGHSHGHESRSFGQVLQAVMEHSSSGYLHDSWQTTVLLRQLTQAVSASFRFVG